MKIQAEQVSTDFFHRQYYHFLKFANLNNFEKYNFICNPPNTELIKFLTIQNKTQIVTGNVQFPKHNTVTNVITFGDWSKTDDGIFTKNYIQSKTETTDAIVFLGDQGYDLYQQEGEIGNDFLYFTKQITSSIPYQVKLKLEKNYQKN